VLGLGKRRRPSDGTVDYLLVIMNRYVDWGGQAMARPTATLNIITSSVGGGTLYRLSKAN
jgi:hypothetical protein